MEAIINEYQLNLELDDHQLTKVEHQRDILAIVKSKATEGEYNEQMFSTAMITKLSTHLERVKSQIQRLAAIPTHKQRTSEWYDQRRNIITASEANRTILKTGGRTRNKHGKPVSYIELMLEKTGIMRPSLKGSDAITHGTIYEIVSQTIYETRNGVVLSEYGCLPHPEHNFIGASPDGIITSVKDDTNLAQLSLLGRMLEIKNPYSRLISDDIKPEYMTQMQQQLEVCNLEYCDFLETSIKSRYTSLTDFLADSMTNENNHHSPANIGIPIGNHSADNGKERGILLHFTHELDDISDTSRLYPITIPYNSEEILAWKEATCKEMELAGYTIKATHFWRLEVFDIKVVQRDRDFWNHVLFPAHRNFWEEVLENRELTDAEKLAKYDNLVIKRFDGRLSLRDSRKRFEPEPDTESTVIPGTKYAFSDE